MEKRKDLFEICYRKTELDDFIIFCTLYRDYDYGIENFKEEIYPEKEGEYCLFLKDDIECKGTLIRDYFGTHIKYKKNNISFLD